MAGLPSSDEFFKELPFLKQYRDVTVPANFRPAPPDWHVVIADVVNSTEAIKCGDYKNVNVLGAMTIIGLLNAAGEIEFPFVFGGDGASFLVPPSLLPAAKRVLLAAKNRAAESFGLTLRAGVVPVERLMAGGFAIGVAKLAVSEHFAQAIFTGGGISRAEEWVKRPPPGENYELPADPSAEEADFTGLECRWNPVRSEKGEVVSLLIQAQGGAKNEVYQEAIAQIEAIFGRTSDYHPAAEQSLSLATTTKACQPEINAKLGGHPFWARWLWLGRMLFQSHVGNLLFGRPLRLAGVDWKNYKKSLIENTDYQKFDDMIRMVISCSTQNREKFEQYLKEQRARGRLAYGLHVTDHALLTCLVFDRHHRHFHFVDGSNGGYALAANSLKEQLKAGLPHAQV
ncbi:MAG TPA: DUF3095 domain-containing protein [Verrucomicrobiae bacterium]